MEPFPFPFPFFYDTFNQKMYLNAFPLFYFVLGRGRGWEKSEYKQQDRNV